jgi:hypothetical protein
MHMQERADNAEDVVRFLRMLLRTIPGPLLIIWDGSPIHRAEVVQPFLSIPMGKRVHRERLPGSAPELNPQKSGPERRETRWAAASAACLFSVMETTKARSRSGSLEHVEETSVPNEEKEPVVSVVSGFVSGRDFRKNGCGTCSHAAHARTGVVGISLT